MGAIRRFSAVEYENNIFTFKIDTRNILTGATNGAENPLTFRIPSTSSQNSFILRVSDGRPDVSIVGATNTTNMTLSFSTAGIYEISMIGKVTSFSFYFLAHNQDARKIIEITRWSNSIFLQRSFVGCINLIVNAPNTLVLPPASDSLFQGIKEYRSDLMLLDTSKVTNAGAILIGVQTPLKSTLNPFWKSLTSFTAIYGFTSLDTSITKIEVISDSITSLSSPMNNTSFTGEFIVNTPNLTTLYRIMYGTGLKPHFGKIDIRKVTTANEWIQYTMTQANTDATLLGWVNNFDWSEVPTIPNKVTMDWYNSKYSNNPAVINAKEFLEAKGYVFTRLIMA